MRTVFFAASAVLAAWFGSGSAQERIVTLGGDMTEIVYALGAGDKIVANDRDSLYPEDAAKMPKVGYLRRLSAEGVLSVEPDLLLVSGAAGPETALRQIRASGIKIISIDTEYTPEAILEKIAIVGRAIEREAEAEALSAEVSKSIAASRERVAAFGGELDILFFAAPPDGTARAAGDDTAAAGVIDMLGGRNVFKGQTGYKTLSLEAAVAADPDVILVMVHHAERIGGLEAVRQHPALSLTSAARAGRVYPVDHIAVMQFGPRTPDAVAALAKEIAGSFGD